MFQETCQYVHAIKFQQQTLNQKERYFINVCAICAVTRKNVKNLELSLIFLIRANW